MYVDPRGGIWGPSCFPKKVEGQQGMHNFKSRNGKAHARRLFPPGGKNRYIDSTRGVVGGEDAPYFIAKKLLAFNRNCCIVL